MNELIFLTFPWIWAVPASLFVAGVYLLARGWDEKPRRARRISKFH